MTVAAGNAQRNIVPYCRAFRHNCIVGAGFFRGISSVDKQLPVSAQLKGSAITQTSLRLSQIDDRAGCAVLGAETGLVFISGAVA